LKSIDDVIKKWTNISGNGGNAYTKSRNETHAKRKLALMQCSMPDTKEKGVPARLPINESNEVSKKYAKTPSKNRINVPSRLPPSHGKVYSPSTAIKHVIKEPPAIRRVIINSMIEDGEIPVQYTRMNKIIKEYETAVQTNVAYDVPRWKYQKQILGTPERPLPSNRGIYTPASAIKHIIDQPINFHIQIMQSMITKKQIPVGYRRIHMLVKKFKEGNNEVPKGWSIDGFTGCPPIATKDEIFVKMKNSEGGRGAVTSTNDMTRILTEINQEKKGISATDVSKRAHQYYTNWIKSLLPGASKVQYKKPTRVKSEKSIRSIAAYLHTIATTHYWVNTTKGARDPPSLKNASEGAQKLYHMISSMYDGAPLSCVHPDLVLSTDDSAIFACKISHCKEEQWFLRYDDDVDTSSQALYTMNKQNDSNGFRSGVSVRMTHTMSASGKLAPIFCQVIHLSERELSLAQCPSGIAMIEIPGLCIGSAIDPRNNSPGYVVFVRQGVNESEILDIYQVCFSSSHQRAS
jgi:hypothetical protein